MKIIDISEATNPLSEYARQIGNDTVVVTVEGKPVAALVAIENSDLETVSLSTNPDFIDIIERSRARYQAEGGISNDELRRRIGSDH